jgi:hypothetical protein
MTRVEKAIRDYRDDMVHRMDIGTVIVLLGIAISGAAVAVLAGLVLS